MTDSSLTNNIGIDRCAQSGNITSSSENSLSLSRNSSRSTTPASSQQSSPSLASSSPPEYSLPDKKSPLALGDIILQSSPVYSFPSFHEKSPDTSEFPTGLAILHRPASKDSEASTEPDDLDFPDGGRGWGVLLGTFLIGFATFGLATSWGTFQAYYQSNILAHEDATRIAWIGSLQYALGWAPGLLSGRLFDLGYFRLPMIIASIVFVASTALVAECTQYWQFMLVQGVATGLAAGFLVGPTVAIVRHWFKRRFATVVGISSTGPSFGGAVIPIIVRKLLPLVGFKWTLRIVSLLMLVILVIANIAVRRRLPPTNVRGGLVNPQAFKSPPYTIYVVAAFIGFLGMASQMTFIEVSGVGIGLSSSFSFYLVALLNAGSVFGRIASGLLSDKFGPMNTLIPFCLASAATTMVWPHCKTTPSLIANAVIYGFTSGGYIAMVSAPAAALGDTADCGRRVGMLFSITAIGSLVGPPISGMIYERSGGFELVGVYSGSTIVIAAGLILLSKWTAMHSIRGKL